jgi:hypothetical protein
MEKRNSNIEMRSEKVRNILGKIPQKLVFWGYFMPCFILIILCVIIFLLKSYMIK